MSYSLNSVRGDYRVFGAFVSPKVEGLSDADALAAFNESARELSIIFDDVVVEIMSNSQGREVVARWKKGQKISKEVGGEE